MKIETSRKIVDIVSFLGWLTTACVILLGKATAPLFFYWWLATFTDFEPFSFKYLILGAGGIVSVMISLYFFKLLKWNN